MWWGGLRVKETVDGCPLSDVFVSFPSYNPQNSAHRGVRLAAQVSSGATCRWEGDLHRCHRQPVSNVGRGLFV